jgi:hypothetical protein
MFQNYSFFTLVECSISSLHPSLVNTAVALSSQWASRTTSLSMVNVA